MADRLNLIGRYNNISHILGWLAYAILTSADKLCRTSYKFANILMPEAIRGKQVEYKTHSIRRGHKQEFELESLPSECNRSGEHQGCAQVLGLYSTNCYTHQDKHAKGKSL